MFLFFACGKRVRITFQQDDRGEATRAEAEVSRQPCEPLDFSAEKFVLRLLHARSGKFFSCRRALSKLPFCANKMFTQCYAFNPRSAIKVLFSNQFCVADQNLGDFHSLSSKSYLKKTFGGKSYQNNNLVQCYVFFAWIS